MTHPGEGTLQALLDDEIRPGERAALERHLAECAACRAEMDALRDDAAELAAAVRLLDEAAPVEQARWRFERRRRRGALDVGRAVRRAAILVLASAVVLSATVPGSPVRKWLSDSWERVTAGPTPPPTAEPAVSAVQPLAEAAPTGVSLQPTNRPMRVVLAGPAAGVRIRVHLHEGERVGVWATGEASGARFRTAADRIEVDGAGSGEVRVEVPRNGPSFTLEVNGRVYLRKEGDQLRFPGPLADTVGPEIVFEVTP